MATFPVPWVLTPSCPVPPASPAPPFELALPVPPLEPPVCPPGVCAPASELADRRASAAPVTIQDPERTIPFPHRRLGNAGLTGTVAAADARPFGFLQGRMSVPVAAVLETGADVDGGAFGTVIGRRRCDRGLPIGVDGTSKRSS